MVAFHVGEVDCLADHGVFVRVGDEEDSGLDSKGKGVAGSDGDGCWGLANFRRTRRHSVVHCRLVMMVHLVDSRLGLQ